jgi:hypothetical protein
MPTSRTDIAAPRSAVKDVPMPSPDQRVLRSPSTAFAATFASLALAVIPMTLSCDEPVEVRSWLYDGPGGSLLGGSSMRALSAQPAADKAARVE